MVPKLNLHEIIDIKHGFAFSSDFFRDIATDHVLLTPGNFHVDQRLYFGPRTKYYDGPIPDGYVLKNGDLLVVMTDLTKNMAILGNAVLLQCDKSVLHNQRIGLVQIKDDARVERRFLCELLNSDIVQKHVRATASGTTVRHTAPKRILEISAPIPPLPEQRKIADILSTWDQAIEKTEALLSNARTQKRALMQQLLTGKRRFPAFADQPWKEVRLGDVLDIEYGKSPKDIRADNGTVPIIGTGGVTGHCHEGFVEGPAIVLGRKGTIDSPRWVEGPFWPIDTTYFCKTNEENSLRWMFYRLSFMNLRAYNEASGVPSLSRETLRSIRISVPSLDEQRLISRTIGNEEVFEDICRREVMHLRTEKKALMQQLLTGKRRVVV